MTYLSRAHPCSLAQSIQAALSSPRASKEWDAGQPSSDLALFLIIAIIIIIIIKGMTWLGVWAGGGTRIELKKWQNCTFEQQEVSQGFPKFSLLPFPVSWKQICQASIKPSTSNFLKY